MDWRDGNWELPNIDLIIKKAPSDSKSGGAYFSVDSIALYARMQEFVYNGTNT